MGKAAGFGIPLWDVEKEKTDRRTVYGLKIEQFLYNLDTQSSRNRGFCSSPDIAMAVPA